MKDNEKIEPQILEKYSILKKLGAGAYGHVWKAKSKATGSVVALKKIFDAFQHSTDAQRTFREISVLNQLKHQKIINLIEVMPSQNNQDIYLVFGYMESDLYHMIYDGKLQPIHIKYLMYQILVGLNYLHVCKLIHRDLKPSNVLINSDCSVKICDFGLVRYLESATSDNNILTQGVATRWYRAPEVLLGSNFYGTKADMWSMGCILAEILLKNPLFPGNCTTNQLERILQFTGQPSVGDIKSLQTELGQAMIAQVAGLRIKKKTDIFSKVDEKDAIDLIYRLLQFNPERRLQAAEAMKHPYFAEFFSAKDLAVKRTPILMEVSEDVKLKSQEYISIIKDKFIDEQATQSPISKKRRISESPKTPKTFSSLKKSRVSSKPTSANKSKSKVDASFDKKPQLKQKSLNLFKQLCKEKGSSKERKKPNDSLNKQNQMGNTKEKMQSFSALAKGGLRKFGEEKNLASFTGLRKISKLNRA